MENGVQGKNTVDFLNIVRLLAFLMVFCLHATSFAPAGWNTYSTAWLLYTPAWAGVYIFFILSGYGTGVGFLTGRYPLETWTDVLRYWWGRFKKLAPMYYLYLLFSVFFVNPSLLDGSGEHTVLLLKLLVFWYEPEVDQFACLGIVWYLCTLLKLYLCAPIFYGIFRRILTSRRRGYVMVCLLILAGFGLRLFGRQIMLATGNGAWHIDIYKPFYMNLDLFFGGFALSACRKETGMVSCGAEHNMAVTEGRAAGVYMSHPVHIVWQWVSALLLIGLVLYNNYIYYQASIEKIHITSNHIYANNWLIYQYILPSVYLVVILLIIRVWDQGRSCKRLPWSWKAVRHNPLRIVDAFPGLMMACYLFHANFLRSLSGIITVESVSGLYTRLGLRVKETAMPLHVHLWHLGIGFCVTVVFAWLLKRQGAKTDSKHRREKRH